MERILENDLWRIQDSLSAYSRVAQQFQPYPPECTKWGYLYEIPLVAIDKWFVGAVPPGKFYFHEKATPRRFRVIDLINYEVKVFNHPVSSYSGYIYYGAHAYDGTLYQIPGSLYTSDLSNFLKFDPVTDQPVILNLYRNSSVPPDYSDFVQYVDIVSGRYIVFCTRYDEEVFVVDVADNVLRAPSKPEDMSDVVLNEDKFYPYDGAAYFFGYDYATDPELIVVYKLDPEQMTLERVAEAPVAEPGDWAAAVNQTPCGKLIFGPGDGYSVAVYDLKSGSLKVYRLPSREDAYYIPSIACVDGKIYIPPCIAEEIQVIDTNTDTVYTIPGVPPYIDDEDDYKYISSFYAPNGKVYFPPYFIDKLLELDPKTDTLRVIDIPPGYHYQNLVFNYRQDYIPSGKLILSGNIQSCFVLYDTVTGEVNWVHSVIAPADSNFVLPDQKVCFFDTIWLGNHITIYEPPPPVIA